jgi:IS5 family transposase
MRDPILDLCKALLWKGKAHEKWEFGCKVSVAASSRDSFVLGMFAEHGSLYDGHTLAGAIEQVERLSGRKVGGVSDASSR